MLQEGIAALKLKLPPEAATRLLDYLALLAKWNEVYNLTAIREKDRAVTHHLLDCLSVLPWIGGRLVDVGSGAGLPGIPIAIARPDLEVVLLEASRKKAAFLEQARSELKLDNIAVVAERVEGWRPSAGFDVVISRALTEAGEFVRLASHLCAEGGRFLAMKGVYPYEELAQLPEGYAVEKVVRLAVPFLAAERHLVIIKKE